MAKQTRIRPLAATTTVDVTILNEGKFQLGKGKLTQVSIMCAEASSGPLRANGIVEFDDNVSNRVSLGSPVSIRGDTIYGRRDAWHWEGEIEVDRDDHILAQIRNNTALAHVWVMGWVIV